jgi:hypothetical protein
MCHCVRHCGGAVGDHHGVFAAALLKFALPRVLALVVRVLWVMILNTLAFSLK